MNETQEIFERQTSRLREAVSSIPHSAFRIFVLFRQFRIPHSAFIISLFLSGCTGAVQSGHNTALDSMDLTQMTDRMAASIAGSPTVQAAIARDGPLKIVVEPVQNEMTAEILPRGQADAFTARVRSLLSKHDPGQFTWIMNRDAFYALRKRELDVDLGPAPDAINPDYSLVARFRTLTHENSDMRSSYYLCVYELTNIKDRTLLWSDRYEVKKKAVKGFLD